MSKRILILTDSIAPPAYAPRIVSLCRHLSDSDWKCTVFSDCEQGVQPFSMPFGEWYQTHYYQSGNTVYKYVADKLFDVRERQFRTFIEAQVNVAEYDVIFCSTCYYFPLQTTMYLARQYNKPFVVDIRDLAEQFGNLPYHTHTVGSARAINQWIHRIFTQWNIRKRNKVLTAADEVITISPWHRDLLAHINPKTHLIYNGFDEQEFYPRDIKSDSFIISYAGKIYNLLFRDPRLLFEALQQLLVEQPTMRQNLRLIFHIDGVSIEPLRELAAQYGLTEVCEVNGYIPKSELLPLLHRSSILLVLTCQSTPEGAHGIMGTKFYEALGVEKPVLCVRSDEECLAQVINETQAGLAGSDAQSVKKYIDTIYREWKTNGFTRRKVQHKALFSRSAQSAQIENIINHIV